MISKSKNARSMEECIHTINHQCILHKGKSFVFPNECIHGEYGNPEEIEWVYHKTWGGILSVIQIGQKEAAQIRRKTYKKQFEELTGLICKNTKSKSKLYELSITYGLTVYVSEEYSQKICNARYKTQIEESDVVDVYNMNDKDTIEKVKEFQFRLKKNNGDEISQIAYKICSEMIYPNVHINYDSVSLHTSPDATSQRLIKYANFGMQPLTEEYQLYALAKEIAQAISDMKHYPIIEDNTRKFIKLNKSNEGYLINVGNESVFDKLNSWG